MDMVAVCLTICEIDAKLASSFVARIGSSLGHTVAILFSGESIGAAYHLRRHVHLDCLAVEDMLVPDVDLEVVLLVDVERDVNHTVGQVSHNYFIAIRVVQVLVLVDFCATHDMLFVFPCGLKAAVEGLEVH